MPLDKITREEFDRRLEKSTERMREKRISLEADAVVLEKYIADLQVILASLRSQSPEGDEASSHRGNNLWVWKVAGQFQDDPNYAEADRLGREWREAQVPEYPSDASRAD